MNATLSVGKRIRARRGAEGGWLGRILRVIRFLKATPSKGLNGDREERKQGLWIFFLGRTVDVLPQGFK